ncbi:unnamed protein product, partial [marine sediment metagenome]
MRLFHRSSSTPLWTYTTTSRVLKVDISASGDYIVAGTEGLFDLIWTESRLSNNYS